MIWTRRKIEKDRANVFRLLFALSLQMLLRQNKDFYSSILCSAFFCFIRSYRFCFTITYSTDISLLTGTFLYQIAPDSLGSSFRKSLIVLFCTDTICVSFEPDLCTRILLNKIDCFL